MPRVRLLVCALATTLACALPGPTSTRAALPPMRPQPAPSIFGINTGTYDTSHAKFAKDIPIAKRLGARWVHFTIAGAHLYKAGRPNFASLDYQVTRARKLGLGVLLSLGGVPTACSISPKPANPTNCPPTTPRALKAYQAFLRAALTHYRSAVEYWESWLEPNHKSFWPSGPNPAQYANLLKAEYQVFQSVNRAYGTHLQLLFAGPADFSIIPGSPGGMPVLPFVHQALTDLGGAHAFDGIALHGYRFPPASTGPSVRDWDSVLGIPAAPNAAGPYPAEGCNSQRWCQMSWPQELAAYEQEFTNHGYGAMPLWLTEFGWPGNAHATDNYHPSFSAQASDLAQAYADLLRLPFVKAAF
jgi:hypothetical protein